MIIGLIGKKRSGKDTCADFLCEKYGFENYKFADPIKRLVADIFLWDDDWVNGSKKETIDPRYGISPRQAQQLVGTELFREHLPNVSKEFKETIGDKIWSNRFVEYCRTLPNNSNIVISDVRFQNEADTIKSLGGTLIKIVRDDSKIASDLHPSETELEGIGFDYEISNFSTIEHFLERVQEMHKHCESGQLYTECKQVLINKSDVPGDGDHS